MLFGTSLPANPSLGTSRAGTSQTTGTSPVGKKRKPHAPAGGGGASASDKEKMIKELEQELSAAKVNVAKGLPGANEEVARIEGKINALQSK